MKIVVTGGCGFIGSHIAEHLREVFPGARLTILDKLTYAGDMDNVSHLVNGNGVRLVIGDICDGDLCRRVVRHADEVGVANDAPAEVAVTDVPDDEAHPVPVDEVGDIVHVPRVRQLVEDREPRPGEDLSQVLGYVGADEPAAPSHHDLRHCIVSGSNDHRIGKILWSFVIDARRLETAVAWTSALSHSVPRVAPWGDVVAAGKSFLNKQLWYAASVPRPLRHDAPWPHW